MNSRTREFFAREDVMVVLTTAPAGLGHVRVMEALRGEMEETWIEVMGFADPRLQRLHRLTSINPRLRQLMEYVQNQPTAEKWFSRFYRKYLKTFTREAEERLAELIKRPQPDPKVVVLVATHFGLAHQLGAVKNRLAKKLQVRIKLALVVTDDSPQKIWAVPQADYIFVPSAYTKGELTIYLQTIVKGDLPEVIVNPYPVAGSFNRPLSEADWAEKKQQVAGDGKTRMKIVIPISGAAVQLTYFTDLIDRLVKNGNFEIVVVARDSQVTKQFLAWCGDQPRVEVRAKGQDSEVVAAYEQVYDDQVVAAEITKPSEQTFKALVAPDRRGGPLLLFSRPVGRQEDDNIRFMLRYGLMPDSRMVRQLAEIYDGEKLPARDEAFWQAVRQWRGLSLPADGAAAAKAIIGFQKAKIFSAMLEFGGYRRDEALSPLGATRFWEKLAGRIEADCRA